MAYTPDIDTDAYTYEMLLPTAPTVLNLVNEMVTTNLRHGHAAELRLPSLHKLAKIVVAPKEPLLITIERTVENG